jgi:hypothetical protein
MRTQNIRGNGADVEVNFEGSATLDAAVGVAWPWPDDGGKTAANSVKELRGVRPIDIITDLRLTFLRKGYEPIPLLDKQCLLLGWSELQITEAEIRRWGVEHPDWMNTGIRTACMPGFDSDVDDAKVARTIRSFMEGWCRPIGRMLIRTGRSPRFAILFRCDAPFQKLSRKLNDDAKIEILASGQLIVVEGVHPETGRPYTWNADAARGRCRLGRQHWRSTTRPRSWASL